MKVVARSLDECVACAIGLPTSTAW